MNKCVCNRGWTGPDCSHHDALPPSPTPYVPDNSTKAAYNMTKKETPYGESKPVIYALVKVRINIG